MLFWPVVVVVVLADLLTKAVAAYALTPSGFPHAVAGAWLRLTLVYNPGAAFGLHLGPWSRGIFLVLTAVVLRAVWTFYRATPDRANLRVFALALLAGGALGNALTRVVSDDGVIDFFDVGVGAHRWPTFNLADVAVTVGAALLFRVLWGLDPRPEPAAADLALGSSPPGIA
ncbi:hypothetical protein tb265_28810 [Gemmatimonadetes bacterium T265]|nr:hypothetical protein tb265_28810 [Gemmatimonadetes bacterium T265]